MHYDLQTGEAEIMTYEEWQNSPLAMKLPIDLNKGYECVHFCKMESYPDYLLGTLCIPIKHNVRQKKRLAFYVQKNRIVFIDDTHLIASLTEKIPSSKFSSLEGFFCALLDELINNDLLYLEELENRISKMESTILNGEISHFNHKIMDFRKELLGLHYYYSQLIEMSEVFEENENEFFNEEHLKQFEFFTRRVSRLQDNAQMLREYAVQVREEYQAQIDIKQNNTMRILTVVTSIFLPLTLIAGWYGMNFTHMPELSWKYGYPFVIAVSIIIVIVCVWICRKKKFL